MEITYQNKIEDLEIYFDYTINKTKEGKNKSIKFLFVQQGLLILLIEFFGILIRLFSGSLEDAIELSIWIFFLTEIALLVMSKFKPRNYYPKLAFAKQIKSASPKDNQIYHLQRKVSVSDNWLEIESSEFTSRWSWKVINKIVATSSYIYIYVHAEVLMIPSRSFPSEQSFLEFGKKLMELQEKKNEQLIGEE
jgi:hypothetical protein